jgi:DnaJ-class molecular chaperone
MEKIRIKAGICIMLTIVVLFMGCLNTDKECEECRGHGLVVCPECGGDGKVKVPVEYRVPCPLCGATGYTESKGVSILTGCEYSSTAICPCCEGSGYVWKTRYDDKPCPVCFGRGEVVCQKCGGTGVQYD